GVDGLLVKPRRPRELADAIATLITDPERRSTLAHAAKERAVIFDITRAVKRVQDVYAALTGAEAGYRAG
ncbi:MAG: glycosyltransferase, partial [Gammaproteobacteria bacterium]